MSAQSVIDEAMMRRALAMGARQLGATWPNPSVGCVSAKGSQVLGRAVTAMGGVPHAEPQALAQAGKAAKGATAYVTLEPCTHHGRTPPCVDALIEAGINRVVFACLDPNPEVAGKGAARLKDAGLDVATGICEAEARQHHAGFFKRLEAGRPLVTLKLATTLDGKIATKTGDSQWITSPSARRFTHLLRARHDAVMVGAGTMRADDPRLTVRGLGVTRQPVRIIVDSEASTPTTAKLFEDVADAPLWIAHDEKVVPPATDADYIPYPKGANGLDMSALMQALGAKGLTRVFCEGGGNLAASLLRAGLVDQLYLMQAGKAIGGDGLSALGTLNVAELAAAQGFDLCELRNVGPDVVSFWVKQN